MKWDIRHFDVALERAENSFSDVFTHYIHNLHVYKRAYHGKLYRYQLNHLKKEYIYVMLIEYKHVSKH